jgi:hypothetical protein
MVEGEPPLQRRLGSGDVFAAEAGFLRAARRLLTSRITGQTWTHPIFDRKTRRPLCPVRVLRPAERELLREKCSRSVRA